MEETRIGGTWHGGKSGDLETEEFRSVDELGLTPEELERRLGKPSEP